MARLVGDDGAGWAELPAEFDQFLNVAVRRQGVYLEPVRMSGNDIERRAAD